MEEIRQRARAVDLKKKRRHARSPLVQGCMARAVDLEKVDQRAVDLEKYDRRVLLTWKNMSGACGGLRKVWAARALYLYKAAWRALWT